MSACDATGTPTKSVSIFTTPLPQALADIQARLKVLQVRMAYEQGIKGLDAQWLPLPTAPYPPIGDEAGFTPVTGTPALRLSRSQISADALQEPARAQAGLRAQALARRPSLSPLFWVGMACLGAGIYLARK